MTQSAQEEKKRVRSEIRRHLGVMTREERAEGARKTRLLLEQQLIWQKARSIRFFAPLAEELDVWPLMVDALKIGKIACLPRFKPDATGYMACRIEHLERDLEPGKFGIREPNLKCAEIAINRLDFVLVPGIGFDLCGRRLGRGRGFYDRLLASIHGTTCGVAFDQQIVQEIPVEPHDILVDCILTPTRWTEV